ncbi:hypothetical protein BAC1_01001 [uncultured bacterium]|nr:hypothetical protein BAC1_01001 [uncultured bacterium]
MRRPATLKDRCSLFKTLVLLAVAVFLPSAADAFPSFGRQVGRDCSYCHTAFPKLNDTGRTFLYNGYRFEAEGEWRAVKDLQQLPVSFEVEIEGLYDNIKTAGVRSEASDLKAEEAEVIAGGAFGRDGRVSALFAVAVQQANDGTFDTVLPKAFIQVNDLLGPSGAGKLNLKAGIDEVGLSFFRPTSTPISNAMFAETLVGAIAADQRFIELNGSFESEGDRTIAHRYRAGIVRESVVSGNKLKGFFASWAATIDEALSLGAIFRAGSQPVAGQDMSYQSYGLAAEAETGPFIFTAGYFKSQNEGAADVDDWLVEALYFIDKFTLGARYEAASFEGSQPARSQTFMARYDILSSAFVQLEYRHRQDSDRVAGGGELEDKARLIFAALF